MLISNRLNGLMSLMQMGSSSDAWVFSSSITRRLIALSIISEMQVVIELLEELNLKLEIELSIEDAEIDFEDWLDFNPEVQYLFHYSEYVENSSNSCIINNIPEIFETYKSTTVSETTTQALRSGMLQLCSDASINHSDIATTLKYGYNKICFLLSRIKEKMTNIPDELYENFCVNFLAEDYDYYHQKVERNYKLWKDEHNWKSQQALEDKRTQEIVKLINGKVLSHKSDISNRDIKNCQIEIQEDALEYGTLLPENIDFECARFGQYVFMNDSIMLFDYTKLGRYLYKFHKDISIEEEITLKEFSIILNLIHHDMAELNPKLKPLLPDYEDNLVQAISDRAISIINHCKPFLNNNISQDFLSQYIKDILNGDVRKEVQKKLGGTGVYTNICLMLGMLKASTKVFKVGTISEKLASCLSGLTDKPNKDSMKRKIDEGARDTKSKIRIWTDAYIRKHCYTETERLFAGLSQNTRK
jgi:hypothetical protein